MFATVCLVVNNTYHASDCYYFYSTFGWKENELLVNVFSSKCRSLFFGVILLYHSVSRMYIFNGINTTDFCNMV